MPHATTPDNVKLYYEETGSGTPILFVHEFASDHRGWEPQMREFGKRHRCIAYSARGYTPSDVPADPNAYSYLHVMRDCVAMLDHLGIERAHLIGLSMGGYTALQVALNHPGRVRSLVLAGTGSGFERDYVAEHYKSSRALADVTSAKAPPASPRPMAAGRAVFHSRSRTRAAFLSFSAASPSTMRKGRPTPCAAFRVRVRRCWISRMRSASWRRPR
jgi:3-oxoadipate enol-lactonase